MEFLPIFLIFFGGVVVIVLINARILAASQKRSKAKGWEFLNAPIDQNLPKKKDEKQGKETPRDESFPDSLLDVGLARARGIRTGLGTIEVGLPVLIEQVRLLREEVAMLRKDMKKRETDPEEDK